ncbi:MAG: hypothetical protein UZ15_CFX003003314, partial [Chloroflexi bacterium OLB15]
MNVTKSDDNAHFNDHVEDERR